MFLKEKDLQAKARWAKEIQFPWWSNGNDKFQYGLATKVNLADLNGNFLGNYTSHSQPQPSHVVSLPPYLGVTYDEMIYAILLYSLLWIMYCISETLNEFKEKNI